MVTYYIIADIHYPYPLFKTLPESVSVSVCPLSESESDKYLFLLLSIATFGGPSESFRSVLYLTYMQKSSDIPITFQEENYNA